MGIYDREYYRREGPSFLASFTERGRTAKWLILINVIVFVIQLLTNPPGGSGEGTGWFTQWLWLDPGEVLNGQVWRLLTYAFLHDGIWHIFFNMLFLWWFGTEVEDLYGPREFLAFYLVSAFIGGLAFMPWALRDAGPSGGAVCLGASGAVTAVMVLYALHFPTRIIYFWGLIPIPIWLFVLFEVGQDAFVFASGAHTATAVTVHLGGAAFGFFYYRGHWRLMSLWPNLSAWRRQRRQPRLRVYRDEEPVTPVSVAAPPPPQHQAADVDEHLEAKLDAVLEKVARHGQDSLTDSERQILVRASEVYKRRRT
jgi:membrane associated rhomboid family serine protease